MSEKFSFSIFSRPLYSLLAIKKEDKTGYKRIILILLEFSLSTDLFFADFKCVPASNISL